MRKKSRAKVNLALQGGGAHGAFTWGVLDRLLEDDGVDLGWISGTSAGAINAMSLAAGMAAGGRSGGQDHLKTIWEAVYRAGVPDYARYNPFLFGLTRSIAASQVTGLLSPYDFNPLGFDPLRRLITGMIDFDTVRAYDGGELIVAATAIRTGRARIFRKRELSPDAVLASACLPTLHHAVEIDGEAYWDGGFSANPDIATLAAESPVGDTLIVQINPLVNNALPTGAREIASHVNTLTFNAPLRREVELILTIRELSKALGRRKTRHSAAALHRFHVIEAGRYTLSLHADSKMKPDWGMFMHLHQAGRAEAGAWLDRHRADIGKRETVDLSARFLSGEGPPASLWDGKAETSREVENASA